MTVVYSSCSSQRVRSLSPSKLLLPVAAPFCRNICGSRQEGSYPESLHEAKPSQPQGACSSICLATCACTYDPAPAVCGHVTVHLKLLAQLPIEEDGVDSTQRVSIHQVLGTVLRVSEHPAPCTGKEAISTKRCSPQLSIRARWVSGALENFVSEIPM